MRFMSSSTKFQYRSVLSRIGIPSAEILRPRREYAVQNLRLPQGFWLPTPVSRAIRKLTLSRRIAPGITGMWFFATQGPNWCADRGRSVVCCTTRLGEKMRIALSIAGVLLVSVGGIWVLQGINVLSGSFMSGQIRWAVYGCIAIAAGIVLLLRANRRRMAR
jgi:hypothetical protein